MTVPFVEFRGSAPLHRQLYEGLKAAISDGRLGRGARLPASRRLATKLGVSRTVVVTAYDQLTAEGFVEGRTGSGTFVRAALSPPRELDVAAAETFQPLWSAEGARLIAADAGPDDAGEFVRWDFTVGQLRPGEFGDRFWRRTLGRELARGAYGPAAGAPELRRAVADYLRSSRGVRCRWEDVVIVQGTRQALDLIARVLLDPGDVVALEEPHYPDARHAFAARGATFVVAPVDRAGLRVDELPEGPASAVYVTPSHHYPTGAVLSIERRHALLRWAGRSGALVLEDDYDSEFRYG
ncbi:MAG: PLP-dependent aminotransferase family protein, partial [Gemmatimonadota bacterium]